MSAGSLPRGYCPGIHNRPELWAGPASPDLGGSGSDATGAWGVPPESWTNAICSRDSASLRPASSAPWRASRSGRIARAPSIASRVCSRSRLGGAPPGGAASPALRAPKLMSVTSAWMRMSSGVSLSISASSWASSSSVKSWGALMGSHLLLDRIRRAGLCHALLEDFERRRAGVDHAPLPLGAVELGERDVDPGPRLQPVQGLRRRVLLDALRAQIEQPAVLPVAQRPP